MLKLVALLAVVVLASAAPEADLMGEMPGCKSNFKSYSGYLEVEEGKLLHYVFTESKSSPENDPLVLWFNGGPGCSSMIGFMQENGPCVIEDGETQPHENEYSWNTNANMLFLETPAGVGFTIAEKRFRYDDESISVDNYRALVKWFEKFPEWKNHKVYLTGESYAGIYVPYLAWQIDNHNKNSSNLHINLQGWAVGNGVTDWEVDTIPAFVEMGWYHGLYPGQLKDSIVSNDCQYRTIGQKPLSKVCRDNMHQFNIDVSHINFYDVYRDVLPEHEMGLDRLSYQLVDGEYKVYKVGRTMKEYTPWVPSTHASEHQTLGDGLSHYLNREDVRKALNIPSKAPAWEQCSNIDYTMLQKASLWIYQELKNKYKILKYSGDTDGAVPTIGTERWINKLDWSVMRDYHAWFMDGQVAGYNEVREGMEFTTIHGTGHMAPQWKRKPTHTMFVSWLQGKDLDEKP